MGDDFPRKLSVEMLYGSSLSSVWISGKIEGVLSPDSIVVEDNTGRVKIVECKSANCISDSSWMQKGSYCSVIGLLINNSLSLPEIKATKIRNMTNDEVSKEMWDWEVKCLDHFMHGKILPII